jgi:hypothetical protein
VTEVENLTDNKPKKPTTKKKTTKNEPEIKEYTNMPFGEFITRYNIPPDMAMQMIYEGELYVVRDDAGNLLVPTFQLKRLGLEDDD